MRRVSIALLALALLVLTAACGSAKRAGSTSIAAISVPQPPAPHDPGLPAGAAVDDVRRHRKPHAGAVEHPPAASVSSRVEPRDGRPARVPGSGLERSRVRRQLVGERPGGLDEG